MVKVIKDGIKKRVTCPECTAVLEYDKTDIQCQPITRNEYKNYIVCPCCNINIVID